MAFLDLTSTARVLLFKDWSAEAKRDAQLDTIVAGVSQRFEFEVKRGLLLEARSEDFDVERFETTFQIEGFPIDQSGTPVALFNDEDRIYGAGTEIAATEFAVYESVGQVAVDGDVHLTTGARALRITYVGGLAANLAALLLIRPDLVLAATRQVAFEFEARDRLGMKTQNLQSGDQVTYTDPGTWLGDMQRIIDQMRPSVIL